MAKKTIEQRSVGLLPDTWKWIEKEAEKETRSVNGQIRHLIEKIRRESEVEK